MTRETSAEIATEVEATTGKADADSETVVKSDKSAREDKSALQIRKNDASAHLSGPKCCLDLKEGGSRDPHYLSSNAESREVDLRHKYLGSSSEYEVGGQSNLPVSLKSVLLGYRVRGQYSKLTIVRINLLCTFDFTLIIPASERILLETRFRRTPRVFGGFSSQGYYLLRTRPTQSRPGCICPSRMHIRSVGKCPSAWLNLRCCVSYV